MSTIVVGCPVSADNRNFSSSPRSSMILTARPRISARSSGDICGHGPSSKALRAAAQAASTSAAEASGTLPTNSPVAGECTSMTSEVAGSTHLPPMNSLSHSVLKAVLCVIGVTLPTIERNENLLQSGNQKGRNTSTRLLTANSRRPGSFTRPHAHLGW